MNPSWTHLKAMVLSLLLLRQNKQTGHLLLAVKHLVFGLILSLHFAAIFFIWNNNRPFITEQQKKRVFFFLITGECHSIVDS